MPTTASNAAQAASSSLMTSFHWDTENISKRHSYVDPKTRFRVGSRCAWYPTEYFEDHVWTGFLLPKLSNVFNRNQKEIFGSRRKPFAEIKCYMTSGSTEWKASRPSVVASSEKPKIAQKIISVLSKNPIISRLGSGFDFYADPDPADTKLSASTTTLYPPELGATASSLCGIRILIAPQPGSGSLKWTHATLGGLVQIDNTVYGLTAAHVFSGDTDSGSYSTENSESEQNDSSRTSFALTNSAASVYSSTYLSQGTTVYIDPAKYTRTIDDGDVCEVLEDGDSPNVQGALVLGELYGTGSQGPWLSTSRDWALIKISDPKYHLPNTLQFNGRTIECSSIATSLTRGQVAVASGFTGVRLAGSSGRTRGVLIPGAPEMIALWTIDGSSLPGDCGSWVIDLTSGQVYGMLLASSKEQNCSYCLSMSEIFDSITSTLGVNQPTIFDPREQHLGLAGLVRPSITDAPAPTQNSGPAGNTSAQEAFCGKQATTDHYQSTTDKPVVEPLLPRVTITMPDTTKEHDEPAIVSEEGTPSLPVAYDPDDGTLLKAVQCGASRYELPTTKVDKSVAQKLGYEIWQGQFSSIVETYGKEFSFIQLVQESRLQSRIVCAPNASLESIPENDGKKLPLGAGTTGTEEVTEGFPSPGGPSEDIAFRLAQELEHDDEVGPYRVDPAKTWDPDLSQIERASPLSKALLHRSQTRASQEDNATRVVDIQANDGTDLEDQGLEERVAKSKDKEWYYLSPSQGTSRSGYVKAARRERGRPRSPPRRRTRGTGETVVLWQDEQDRDNRRDFDREGVTTRRQNSVERTRGGGVQRWDSDYGNARPGYTTLRRDVGNDDARNIRSESFASRRTDKTEDISVTRSESIPRAMTHDWTLWDSDTNVAVVRNRNGPGSPAEELNKNGINRSEATRAEPRTAYRHLEAAHYPSGLSAEEQRMLQEDIDDRRGGHSPRHYYDGLESTDHNKFSSQQEKPAQHNSRKLAGSAYASGSEDNAPRGWSYIPATTNSGEDSDRQNSAGRVQQSFYNPPSARSSFAHDGPPTVEPEPISGFESKESLASGDEVNRQRPRRGTTTIPKRLVRTKVLDEVGYNYVEINSETILIKHALEPEDIDEVLSLSNGPLSNKSVQEGRPDTQFARRDRSSGELPATRPITPRHERILRSHRDLLEEYRRAEKRLLFKCQIQQIFLEGELPATPRIGRIMQHYDEHLGPVGGDRIVVEALKEDGVPVYPKPARREPEYTDTTETDGENGRTTLNDLVDKLTNELRRLGLRNNKTTVEGVELADDKTAATSVRHAENREPYRSAQQQSPPGVSSKIEPSNVWTLGDEEEYKQLQQKYRAIAITRGLSLGQIDTILSKIDKTPGLEAEEYNKFSQLQALRNLLIDLPTVTEQKEVRWWNPPASSRPVFVGEDESYRSEEMAPLPERGIPRGQSRLDTPDHRSRDRTTKYTR